MMPQAIFVQTSNRCTANCTICPYAITYAKQPKQEMAEVVWDRLMGEVHRLRYEGQIGLYLHCDPLCDSRLGERLRDISESPAFALVSTNGALLTPERIESLLARPPASVHLNIMAGHARLYAQRMHLPFASTMKRIRAFVDAVQSLSPDHRPALVINAPVVSGVSHGHEQTAKRFPECSLNLFQATSRAGLIEGIDCQGHDTPFVEPQRPGCFQPSRNLPLLVDGEVLLCCMDWKHETKGLGNILDIPLDTLYARVAHAEVSFRKGNYRDHPLCTRCAREMRWKERTHG